LPNLAEFLFKTLKKNAKNNPAFWMIAVKIVGKIYTLKFPLGLLVVVVVFELQ